MSKQIVYREHSRQAILRGVNQLADAAKVTRTALQNAASIASLMLTTEAMICERLEEEESAD
jgi:chaperonin GroEL (HSP60 family)